MNRNKSAAFRRTEKLAKQGQKSNKPVSCAKCPYYQPNFKYRTCLYAKCQMDSGHDVFRKKPLKRNKFSGNEVVRMDVSGNEQS